MVAAGEDFLPAKEFFSLFENYMQTRLSAFHALVQAPCISSKT